MSSPFTPSLISETISWQQYLALAQQYVNTNDKPEKYRDEKMLRYTYENVERIQRVLEQMKVETKLYNTLNTLGVKWTWVVLTEPWCGDAAQVVPALYTLSTCSENIDFRILLSDSHSDILDQFLTKGSRSIPKLICINELQEVIGTWGPRPAILQQLVLAQKDDTTKTFGDKVRSIHQWYEQDKTNTLQEEFVQLVKEWKGGIGS